MDNRTVVGALSIQLNAACILCTLIYWFSQSELGRIGPYPLVLLAYGPCSTAWTACFSVGSAPCGIWCCSMPEPGWLSSLFWCPWWAGAAGDL